MSQTGLSTQHRRRHARATRALLVLATLAATTLATAPAAMAFKPYAHNYIGDQAYKDAIDGDITLGTRKYSLDSRLVYALNYSPASYNAGVVGPDGFPDLAFGQSLIHPKHTGKWLSYIWQKAWEAQDAVGKDGKPVYDPPEKARALAFAYGFLTHAAGDMWGHTLINDFARGLFPSLDEIQDDRDSAIVALRHIVAEGYAGSATPGWDRTIGSRAKVCGATPTTPGTKCDDVSDDQTGAIKYGAPHKFLYDILVSPDAVLPVGTCQTSATGPLVKIEDDDGDGIPDDGCPKGPFTDGPPEPEGTPEPQRGPLIDYFLDKQSDVQLEAAKRSFDATRRDCDHDDRNCVPTNVVRTKQTVRGERRFIATSWRCKAGATCGRDSGDEDQDADDEDVARELNEWSIHIRDGLREWTRFSLAVSQALFDPQTRRDAQNDLCRNRGIDELPRSGDSDSERRDKQTRRECENDIGMFKTVEWKTRDFVNEHLLSMLGYEDVAKSKSWWEELAEDIDDVVGEALNPIRWVANEIEEKLAEFVKEAIRDAVGLDVDELRAFLTKPARWMCGTGAASIDLPGMREIKAGELFTKADHDRLDRIMGLQPNHHVTASHCSALRANAQYDPARFAPVKNSITQAKLLLLDGPELDRALGDVLVDARLIDNPALVRTYPPSSNARPSSNIMFTSLGTTVPWLDLIDGDHAWRQNGLPRFCDNVPACLTPAGASVVATPRNTGGQLTGGTGQYPIWESCVLRPAFRGLFTDWENAVTFPDLGDGVSPDPATDPRPPAVTVTPAAVTTTIDGKPFVLPGTSFTVTAHDDVFIDASISVSYRMYKAGTAPGPFQPVPNGGTFALPLDTGGGDWVVEAFASDNCATSQPGSLTVGIA